jgi:hypothetical protein
VQSLAGGGDLSDVACCLQSLQPAVELWRMHAELVEGSASIHGSFFTRCHICYWETL